MGKKETYRVDLLEFKEYASLTESKASAKKKFLDTGLISNELFNVANELDTTKTKKYLEAIISMWLEDGEVTLTDVARIINDFDELLIKNKLIGNRDITQYKNLKQLEKTIRLSVKMDTERESEILKKGNFEVILDNKDLLVVIPLDYKSSCQWGDDTHWCTTSKLGSAYFFSTTKKSTLYYIFIKNPRMVPISHPTYQYIAVEAYPNGSHVCWDADDEQIFISDVLNVTGLDKDIFTYRDF